MAAWSLLSVEESLFVQFNGKKLVKPNGEEFGKITSVAKTRNHEEIKIIFENSKNGKVLNLNSFEKGTLLQGVDTDCKSSLGFIKVMNEKLKVPVRKRPFLEPVPKIRKSTELVLEGAENMPGIKTTPIPPSFAAKSKGVFTVELKQLTHCPEKYRVRRIREDWVKEIKSAMIVDGSMILPTIIPVILSNNVFNEDHIMNYQFSVVGGNHMLQALRELQEETGIKRNVKVEVFVGVTDDEIRSIANTHNSKLKSLPVTFQDKVYQARQLAAGLTEDKLSQAVSKMLTEVTLQEVSPGTCTTIVSVAKYSEEDYSLVEAIFKNYESTTGVGKSIPVKLFRLLQGPILKNEKTALLLQARDDGIAAATTRAAEMKNRKLVQNNVVACLNAKDWQQAQTFYPNYTTDNILDIYSGFRMQNKIPRPLLDFLQHAAEDQNPPVQPDKLSIDINIKYDGEDLGCLEIKKKYEKNIKDDVLKEMVKRRKLGLGQEE